MQITISQAEIYEKLNQIYLLEPRGNTLGESTPPNHRRQQLNSLLRSTLELDHQLCIRTASNFLAALNPRVRNNLQQESFHAALSLRVRNKLRDGLMKMGETLNTCIHSKVSPCTTWCPVLFQCTHIYRFCTGLMPSQSNLQSDP